MPVLPNAKHERFAQEIANGKTLEQAHAAAGYKADRRNAIVLRRRDDISLRVDEILSERESIHAKGVAKAIERTGITKAWVIDRLRENVERAMTAEPVRDQKGNPTGEWTYQGGVANKALELLGKELGMFVERRAITLKRIEEMNEDELAALLGDDAAAGTGALAGAAPAGRA